MSSSRVCFNNVSDILLNTLIDGGARFYKMLDFGRGKITFFLKKNPQFDVLSHQILFDHYKNRRNDYGVVESLAEAKTYIKIRLVYDPDYICPDFVDSATVDSDTDVDSDISPDQECDCDQCRENFGHNYDDDSGVNRALPSDRDNISFADHYDFGSGDDNYPNNGDCRPLKLTSEEKIVLRQRLDDELDDIKKIREAHLSQPDGELDELDDIAKKLRETYLNQHH